MSGTGLVKLTRLPLTTLGMSKCPVTSKGMAKIGRLKQLTTFDRSFTDIQDADLKALHGLRALRFLDLTGTDVSRAAVERLMRAVWAQLVVEEPVPYLRTMLIPR